MNFLELEQLEVADPEPPFVADPVTELVVVPALPLVAGHEVDSEQAC